jgi:REP element-mobilizing transposase RayT
MKTDILCSTMTIEHLRQAHSVSCLLYHIVSVVKYRKKIFTPAMEEHFKWICRNIEDWTEITFHEIGIDLDHVHFLIQSIPRKSPASILQDIRRPTAQGMFDQFGELKDMLKGWHFWTDGYYINTVWLHTNQETIQRYIQNQWRESEYKRLHISPDQIQFKF